MKKILITVLSLVCALCLFTACSKTITYQYTNPNLSTDDWRDLTVDEGITIDGKFDEGGGIYDNKNEFSFSPDGYDYKLTVSNYFGGKGVYFKVVVEDPGVFYNTNDEIFKNSSVILYVAPLAGGAVPVLNANAIQLRVAANGTNEQWIGRKSADGYAYARAHIDNMSRTQIIAKDGTFVEFNRYGEVNLSDVKGYQAEIFMPYAAIGLTEKPSRILVAPEFNKRMAFSDSGRVTFMPKGVQFAGPGSWLGFNENGYMPILNQGANMYGNLGFDLTSDIAGDTKRIEQKGTGDQKLYFNDLEATKYMVEAEITVKGGSLNNDNFPKFGLLAAENSDNTLAYFVDPFKALTGKDVLAVCRTDDGKDWVWGGAVIKNLPYMQYKDGNTVKMSLIRDGAKFYFFIDGTYVGSRSNIRGFDADKPSKAGFMTMNFNAEYTQYSATTDSKKIDAVIAGTYTEVIKPTKLVYRVDDELDLTGGKIIVKKISDGSVVEEKSMTDSGITVTGFDKTASGLQTLTATYGKLSVKFDVSILKIALDASLTDWTAEMKRNSLDVREENGTRGYTAYAFYDTTGLYIGVEAKHKTNPNTSNNWWENTNFEFFLNGNNQRYINNKGALGGIRPEFSIMQVTGEENNYTSTVEIFIPKSELPGNVNDAFVRVGFAFKVAGEAIKIPNRDGGNATDWWWEDRHYPNNGAEQFYVSADGIFREEPTAA